MAMNQINSVKPNSVQKKMKDKRANRSRRWKSELDEVSLDQIRGTDQELTFKCPDGMEARGLYFSLSFPLRLEFPPLLMRF